jgi:hypothetical protein
VPISTLGQKSRNEKHIRTSITERNIHLLSKSVTSNLQEVFLIEAIVPVRKPAEPSPFFYEWFALQYFMNILAFPAR